MTYGSWSDKSQTSPKHTDFVCVGTSIPASSTFRGLWCEHKTCMLPGNHAFKGVRWRESLSRPGPHTQILHSTFSVPDKGASSLIPGDDLRAQLLGQFTSCTKL